MNKDIILCPSCLREYQNRIIQCKKCHSFYLKEEIQEWIDEGDWEKHCIACRVLGLG